MTKIMPRMRFGHGASKLSEVDIEELKAIAPADLDGCKWEDVVRVARAGRGYVLKKTTTGRVLGKYSTIDAALEEAQRRNRGR